MHSIAPQPLLSLRDVSKVYASTGAIAVENVNMALSKGEFVSLVGPSGCGKTTAMKLAVGLVDKTEGTIAYKGQPGTPRPGTYGIVFQQPVLLPWWTVEQNVLLPAKVLGLDPAASRARCHKLLELVGLANKEKFYPRQLSGGMRQRVSIARSLLHEPELLFMDEPFGALDAITRERLNFELLQIQDELGVTVLFVTHGISEAVLLSDRVIVMSASPGRMIGEIRIDLAKPRGPQTLREPRFRELEAQTRDMLDAAEAPADGGIVVAR